MKKLVFSLLVLFAVIAGVGLYRGWFTVNQTKMRQDEAVAENQVRGLVHEAEAKTGSPAAKVEK